MTAFVHSIPPLILRYFPVGLAAILLIYTVGVRRSGGQQRTAPAAFNPIVLVLLVGLLVADIILTFLHRR